MSCVIFQIMPRRVIVHSQVQRVPQGGLRPASQSSASVNNNNDDDDINRHESYEQRHIRISRKQAILQHELQVRINQLNVLIKRVKSKRRLSHNKQIFLEFLQLLLIQYKDLARKNREAASEAQVRENERAMKKLIWWDELENVRDILPSEIVPGEAPSEEN